MATALVKSKLKAAREAITAKDWPKAEKSASDALTFDSSNYNARVFLAVANLNLGKVEESEDAYKAAIDSQPTTLLAWQGLASLYEKTARWSDYVETQQHLADLARNHDDTAKCAEALQKILNVRREHGSPAEVLETLKLFLPDSPYYNVLSQLPMPDNTNPTGSSTYEAESFIHNSLPILEELLRVKEAEEQSAIQKEVEKRRQRLTTTTSAEETRKAVMQEVMSKSELPTLYQQVMDHHQASDELRRDIEKKLLQYNYDLLLSVQSPFADALESAQSEVIQEQSQIKRKAAQIQKDQYRQKVQSMAKDIVTLRIPLPLAWTIVIEWREMDNEEDWDDYTLKRFIDLFPDSGLSILLQIVRNLPGPLELDARDPKKEQPSLESFTADVDAAFEEAQATSIRAHVLTSDFYLRLKDYELVADIAQAGISLTKSLERQIGLRLPGLNSVLEANLAIALTHLNPPLQHTRALRLLDGLLRRRPGDLRCLLARAYIYEHAERWQEANDHFERIHTETSDDIVKFETRAEKAWCLGNIPGQAQNALEELHAVATEMDQNAEIDRIDKARAWWRYGQCSRLVRDEEHQTAAFDAFNASILRDNTYAPSFTSLGFYYTQDISPPDEESATRCFQRAFELDEREELAARMLAESYSETEDWDLVEAIARRLVRNLHAGQGKYGAVETPAAGSLSAKKYGWAWKAIGMADLKSKRFEKAIPSLQQAVRGMQEDASCWLQLAIAYRGAGKHVASLKTLLRVTTLEPSNWQAKYLIADIQRQIGLFEEALAAFISLRQELPDEIVIEAAIAETCLSLALFEARNGFSGRCANNLIACLSSCLGLLDKGQAASRIGWKTIGDALLKLSSIKPVDSPGTRHVLEALVARLVKEDIDKSNPSVTVITTSQLADITSTKPLASVCAALAVLAYSMRMLLYSQADDAAGSAWFDIGQALHRLEAHYAALGLSSKPEEVRTESLQCVRAALQKEPLNGTFWNLLGVLSAKFSPKLAQHALIRACELNLRSAVPWTNLGLFYLAHDDYELANKAFLRAQVIDPDYPQAWLGQAALARVHGEESQAIVLTAHAAVLSNGSVPEAELASAWSTFKLKKTESDPREFVKSSFQLSRYLEQRSGVDSSNSAALHLDGLLKERIGYFDAAVESYQKSVQLLESEYEDTESSAVERQFVLANISLGRASLANGGYSQANDAIDAALNLLGNSSYHIDFEGAVHRVQGLLLKALSAFWSGSMEDSLEAFEQARSALDEVEANEENQAQKSKLSNQITLLLARVLYKLGEEEQIEEAERQLLENIYVEDAPNIPIITTLSALAIIKSNDELLEAALSEIIKLPMDKQLQQDPAGDIVHLLASQQHLQTESSDTTRLYAHAMHASPHSETARRAYERGLGEATVASPTDSQGRDGPSTTASHKLHRKPWKHDTYAWPPTVL